MKNRLFFLPLFLVFSISCALFSAITPRNGNTPPVATSDRCGDKTCKDPENPENCPQDCTLPHEVITQASPATNLHYTFHVNMPLKVTVNDNCSVTTCDYAYLPQTLLYFNGEISTDGGNKLRGDGTIKYIDTGECITHHPELSSCKVNGVTDGKFSVSGEVLQPPDASSDQPARLQLTFESPTLPKLDGAMITQHPSGPVTIPLSYIDTLVKMTLDQAKVFNTPFEIVACVLTTAEQGDEAAGAMHIFQGSATWPSQPASISYTMNAFGSVLFLTTE